MRILSILIVCIVALLHTPPVNANQQCPPQVIDMSDAVLSLDYSVTDLLAITTTSGVEVYDQDLNFVAQLNVNNTEMDYAVWANNSNLLLLAGNAPNIQVWNYDTNELAFEIPGGTLFNSNPQWSYDDKYVILRENDTTYIYDVLLQEKRILAAPALELEQDDLFWLEYLIHPNKPYVFLSTTNRAILQNYETNEIIYDYFTDAFSYKGITWVNEGDSLLVLYTTRRDYFFGTIYIMVIVEFFDGNLEILFATEKGNGFYTVTQQPYGKWIAIYFRDEEEEIQFWQLGNTIPEHIIELPTDSIINGDAREYNLSWNSTGQYVAVGFLNGEVQIIDTTCFEAGN